MRYLLAVAFCVLGLGQGLGQESLTQAPAFEVASVKLSTPAEHVIALSTYPGGRITITNYSLHAMLQEAFHVQPFQIVGGPRWVREERYSVEAKPPASSQSSKSNPPNTKSPPNDEQRRMLQTLLTDRFQLELRRETHEGPVYVLTRGSKPLKLQPPKDPNAWPWAGSIAGGGFGGDGMRGTNVMTAEVAERLGPYLEHPVVDQTGLGGSFDFRVEYSSAGERPDLVASLFASLQELGLKLKAGRGPVETITIDRAEKPAAN